MLTPMYDKLYTKALTTYTPLGIFFKCKFFLHLNYICFILPLINNKSHIDYEKTITTLCWDYCV